ncbi:hypothetical protein OAO87_00750 [bacterium]|nr:hypothetical protein [bacterium]
MAMHDMVEPPILGMCATISRPHCDAVERRAIVASGALWCLCAERIASATGIAHHCDHATCAERGRGYAASGSSSASGSSRERAAIFRSS